MDLYTAVLILLFVASFLLVGWVYRPSSKSVYNYCSNIPLQDEKYLKVSKKSGRKKSKKN